MQAEKRDIPFHACWGIPQTSSTNFFKICKTPSAWQNHKNANKKREKIRNFYTDFLSKKTLTFPILFCYNIIITEKRKEKINHVPKKSQNDKRQTTTNE